MKSYPRKAKRHSNRFTLWTAVASAAAVCAVLAFSVHTLLMMQNGADARRPAETAAYAAPITDEEAVPSTAAVPEHLHGGAVDITVLDAEKIDKLLGECASYKLDSVMIRFADDGMLEYTVGKANALGLKAFVEFDVGRSIVTFAGGRRDLSDAAAYLRYLASLDIEGIIFKNADISTADPLENRPVNMGLRGLCGEARRAKDGIVLGLRLDPASDSTAMFGAVADECFDLVIIPDGAIHGSVRDSGDTALDTAIGNLPVIASVSSSLLGTKSDGWDKPDRLLRQVMVDADSGFSGFMLDSVAPLTTHPAAAAALVRYINGSIADGYVIRELTVTSPSAAETTTYNSVAVIAGASDPEFPLTVNGKAIERDKSGVFEYSVKLKAGKNNFAIEHNGQKRTVTINYKYVIITDVFPSENLKPDSGSLLRISVVARKDSKVSATVGTQTVKLSQDAFYNTSADLLGKFYTYVGTVTLPSYTSDKSLGRLKITATNSGVTEVKYGGSITVRKKPASESGQVKFTLPAKSGYIDVGTGTIAEVVTEQTETFDGQKLNDYSQPSNSYLPKGTVDYCKTSANILYDDSGKILRYRTLRYGKRVYEKTEQNGPEIKIYKGTLPDTNTVGVAQVKETVRNTSIAFSVEWKAPFDLELKGQKYIDDKNGDPRPYYTVESVTYTHVDITFRYAVKAGGEIPLSANHPLFKGCEWIKNQADTTLRLYLRSPGSFYGWSAEYDADGRLVFTFLHPVQLVPDNNEYGVSLKNAVILLDPGHTGTAESGAVHDLRKKSSAYAVTEAEACLTMCKEIKKQLEKLGAAVYLTRDTNDRTEKLTLEDRVRMIRKIKPDVFVSVHHNYFKYQSANGYENFYFTPMSYRLGKAVLDATVKARYKGTPLYEIREAGCIWHTFYVNRVTDCPSILTENGFISNNAEYKRITNPEFNRIRSSATVAGIVNYFKGIQNDLNYLPPGQQGVDLPGESEVSSELPPDASSDDSSGSAPSDAGDPSSDQPSGESSGTDGTHSDTKD